MSAGKREEAHYDCREMLAPYILGMAIELTNGVRGAAHQSRGLLPRSAVAF
jgi:hypothetical protein